jgi:ketosteroid isomerase-like protein
VCLALGVCEPAVALAVHHPQKQNKHATRETVEALEEQYRLAQLNGDAAAMDRLLADDYVGITAFGQVTTKAQQLARVRDHVLQLNQLDVFDIKVKRIGQVAAVVTSRAEVAGINDGKPIKGTFRYTRVYQRLPNGMWKITSFEATRVPSDRGPRARAEAVGPGTEPTPQPQN